MSSLSTHVLDAVRGTPATGVGVTLYAGDEVRGDGRTDGDGRIAALGSALTSGTYRLVFDTGAYFARLGVETFYPEVSITFAVTEERHYHVPLLLSPFAFSTYRGS
ncbi:hydroxyisourate hydrolase [Nocardia bovistercoris]|uniref:5-hydroxyisourate hydrolase n=1 Tax=Nocardia bovistercoris TaxID=2785916 RepID=A0A931IBA3_9NOCA|nr:hydroxyisourate hydrolase [Nocardia bovistercoris]MBH0778259.1 hydroxyisourate hydrolase [Nocardia bovistercoris]